VLYFRTTVRRDLYSCLLSRTRFFLTCVSFIVVTLLTHGLWQSRRMQTGPKFLSQQWEFCLFISLPITCGVLSVLVELKSLSRLGAGEKVGGDTEGSDHTGNNATVLTSTESKAMLKNGRSNYRQCKLYWLKKDNIFIFNYLLHMTNTYCTENDRQ
jgi:hypothetical protein